MVPSVRLSYAWTRFIHYLTTYVVFVSHVLEKNHHVRRTRPSTVRHAEKTRLRHLAPGQNPYLASIVACSELLIGPAVICAQSYLPSYLTQSNLILLVSNK